MTPYPPDPSDATGPMRLVLTSFPSEAAARRAADRILAERLAACVQKVPIRSSYWWNGTIVSGEEILVIAKTLPKKVGALFRRLAELHPYEVPEIIEIDVPRVTPSYLDYLAGALGESPTEPSGPSASRPRPGSRRAPGARGPRGIRGRLRPR